jgi:hypothetical protein
MRIPVSFILILPLPYPQGKKAELHRLCITTAEKMCHLSTLQQDGCYRQKIAQAKGHLINCVEFKKLMNSIDISEQPEWYDQESSRKKLNNTSSSGSSSTQISNRNYALPPLKKAEHEKLRRVLQCIITLQELHSTVSRNRT